MSVEEKKHFSEMPEELLKSRWNSKKGKEIKEKIISINFAYGSSKDYKNLVGTVKTDLGKKPPKIDLRGIDFCDFSAQTDFEVFSFDFSGCSLTYSSFRGSSFTSSIFSDSDILYSDFSHAMLSGSDFAGSNLTLTNFDKSDLDGADFRRCWISDVSFRGANLGFVKYNHQTDFYNIDIEEVKGSSNPLFVSFIRRKHYLKHFKEQSLSNKILYYVWLGISDCGQSLLRWSVCSILLCAIFGFAYSQFPNSFYIANNRPASVFTFYYYSVVTFTTLGFGDIIPIGLASEVAVTAEVTLGYIMLGGLISIFATKFIPKS